MEVGHATHCIQIYSYNFNTNLDNVKKGNRFLEIINKIKALGENIGRMMNGSSFLFIEYNTENFIKTWNEMKGVERK